MADLITVRGVALGELRQEEVREFVDWAEQAQTRTTFDHAIIGYKKTSMLIAEKHGSAVAYLPAQTVVMAEVFIPRPDATNREKAYSLGKFDESLMALGRELEVGDVYCYVPVAEADYADKVQRHGWEEVPAVRLFKKRTGVKIQALSEPSVEAGT
jgi:hypothetical protein